MCVVIGWGYGPVVSYDCRTWFLGMGTDPMAIVHIQCMSIVVSLYRISICMDIWWENALFGEYDTLTNV
jgi:hypothetical protein